MSKKVLIFDNYDSFTYNLYHLLHRNAPEGYSFEILRNGDERVLTMPIDLLVISPGPMGPEGTGLLKTLFEKRIVREKIPVFGVCLGMQFLAYFWGGRVFPSNNPVHGRQVSIEHSATGLFKGIPRSMKGARYNSLEVSVPSCIEVIAREKDSSMIMALAHKTLPQIGVQFHPESFLTPRGAWLIQNLFKMYKKNEI